MRTYNAAIPGVVAERVAKGEHVAAVNMSAVITASDLGDGLHPLDEGYVKMAGAWYEGIQQVADLGWIEAPLNVTVTVPSSSASPSSSSSSSASPTSTKKSGEGTRGKPSVVWLGLSLGVFWSLFLVSV